LDAKELAEKLSTYPDIKHRIEELMMVVENSSQEIKLADVAEEQLIEGIRNLGRELMESWANRQASRVSLQVKKRLSTATKHIKKKSVGTRRLEK
jgi:hypothetical protein